MNSIFMVVEIILLSYSQPIVCCKSTRFSNLFFVFRVIFFVDFMIVIESLYVFFELYSRVVACRLIQPCLHEFKPWRNLPGFEKLYKQFLTHLLIELVQFHETKRGNLQGTQRPRVECFWVRFLCWKTIINTLEE